MLVDKIFEINSCDDVELKIKRKSKLEYRISYDDSRQMRALVFIIGGYGANANIHFLDSYRKFVARKFDVVAIHVFYHCFCQRRSDVKKYDASAQFLDEDLRKLAEVLSHFHMDTKTLNSQNALYFYELLNERISKLKAEGRLAQNYQAKFSSTFIPPNEEYQNFGIMAAIDHINALKHIMKNFPQFKNLPKIYGGGLMGVI